MKNQNDLIAASVAAVLTIIAVFVCFFAIKRDPDMPSPAPEIASGRAKLPADAPVMASSLPGGSSQSTGGGFGGGMPSFGGAPRGGMGGPMGGPMGAPMGPGGPMGGFKKKMAPPMAQSASG